METVALYIGYIILVTLGIVLMIISIYLLWQTVHYICLIMNAKWIVWFMKKSFLKNSIECSETALRYLLGQGASKSDTLEDIERRVEELRRRQCRMYRKKKQQQ